MRQTVHLCMFLLRGPPYGCDLPVGVCLISLACAALWLRPRYGSVLHMFGMGRLWPRCPYGRVLNMFGKGRPMAALSLWACA